MKFYGLVINVVSIQKYLFGSNKLKESQGASYLIKHIYDEPLQTAIGEIFTDPIDFQAWREKPSQSYIAAGKVPFEIGYKGGGNALLFFSDEKKLQEFVSKWTTKLLKTAPGVVTAVACNSIDSNHFKESMKELFKKLRENKYKHIPAVIIPRHGITAECSHTGYAVETYNKKEHDYLSSVANATVNVSEDALDNFRSIFEDILGNEFTFTNNLEMLGQSKGKDNFIAIVHIDGNDMGYRFSNAHSIESLRTLVLEVERAAIGSFEAMLAAIKSQIDALGLKKNYDKKKRRILPLTPIIVGGDDITFVCDGRLGVYLAKLFIDSFETFKVNEKEPLSACAGIAVIKTKYPFYRGYMLAEELCKKAKDVRRRKKDTASWLDFHISYGGISGTLKEIRESQYNVDQGNLLYRPYKTGSSNGEAPSLEQMIESSRELKKFPNTRINELRSVLSQNENVSKIFVDKLKARGEKLPEVPGIQHHKTLFQDSRAPYLDMIELMMFTFP